MTEKNPNTSPEQEPTAASADSTPTTPEQVTPAPGAAPAAASEPLPAQPAPVAPAAAVAPARPFWQRTGTRVAAGVVAAVVLLLVGFGGGWLVRGELHRPFGVTAPGQGWNQDRGGMPGGGMPGMRDHDGDGDRFGGQRQNGDQDGDQSDDQPTPDSTPNS
jgi:hypothetical protein